MRGWTCGLRCVSFLVFIARRTEAGFVRAISGAARRQTWVRWYKTSSRANAPLGRRVSPVFIVGLGRFWRIANRCKSLIWLRRFFELGCDYQKSSQEAISQPRMYSVYFSCFVYFEYGT